MPAVITIRAAEIEDGPAIGLLRREVAREAYSRYDANEVSIWADVFHSDANVHDQIAGARPSLMLVAEIDGQLAGTGYVVIGRQDHGADSYLGGLYLRPFARGQGVAKALVAQRLQWASDNGARRVLTEVAAGNLVAERLLDSFGFVERSRMASANVSALRNGIAGLDWRMLTLDV